MSRIHEALEKARMGKLGESPELPNVEEIIATSAKSTEAAATAALLTASDAVSLDMPGIEQDDSILAHCVQRDWPVTGNNLIFLADETHATGQEQFRTLRSRLYQLRGADALKVIVVSSAIPGEGKSFVSANLAHAFAIQSGRRALLIDADLRRTGGISKLLEVPVSPGLADYLLGEQPITSVIQKGSLDNLYVIPCGKRTSNPGELVGDPRLGILIEQLRPAFDWIIIDTPPIIPIADARMIAELGDGVLMVVNARSTLAHLAKRAVEQFRRESIVGVVLNRTTTPSATYYSEYGYGDGKNESMAGTH